MDRLALVRCFWVFLVCAIVSANEKHPWPRLETKDSQLSPAHISHSPTVAAARLGKSGLVRYWLIWSIFPNIWFGKSKIINQNSEPFQKNNFLLFVIVIVQHSVWSPTINNVAFAIKENREKQKIFIFGFFDFLFL